MNVRKELEKILSKVECGSDLTVDDIKLNSDLGIAIIENLVKNINNGT